jgi:hypothetical protein
MALICLPGTFHVCAQSVCRVAPQRIADQYNSFVGILEKTGRNDGPVIEAIIRSTGSPARSPYCASFVDSCLRAAGVSITPRSAWSPAFFPVARRVYWQHKPVAGMEPERGDVIGIWFSNLRRIAHVGFWDLRKALMLQTVEANTSDANYGEASRNGHGIFRKWRHIKQIHGVSRWKNCKSKSNARL